MPRMQAVILAAGKGTRMKALTEETPKPLLPYQGKSLLEWKIERLPDCIDEVIIVIGYLGEKIQEKLGDSQSGKKITYVWDKDLGGTAGSLWKAKDVLRDNFLVMMGDDIYSPESLTRATNLPWSITARKIPRHQDTDRIELDSRGNPIGFLLAPEYRNKYPDDGFGVTGLWSLTSEIFNFPLVQIPTKPNEYGLTHTIFAALPHIPLKLLETDTWDQITAPEDLK